VSEACWDVIYKHAVLNICFNCPESLIGAESNSKQALWKIPHLNLLMMESHKPLGKNLILKNKHSVRLDLISKSILLVFPQ